VVFDFYGGNRASKSGGEMTEMSVLTEAEDLNAVMDGVRALEYVDKDQFFLLGCSQGGFVSSYVAASRPEDVKALILLFPAFALQDDCWSRHASIDEIPETEDVMNQTIGAIYSRDAMSFDIYDVIGGYKGDVLIQHGDKDDIVDPSYSERAAEVYEHAELQILHGAGHGFQSKPLKESNAKLLEFLAAHTE
jgi:pimeloyl-ACP methyl ester carboxylesterase